ncbi:sensor domain-containing diguanylate cyclase [Mariniblastus fucicola]|uniref:diguanylate cyclase n=1 Tax=Mariniblastus fucicola TaxID=980251 RepID=A0A5B9P5G0_9BACT|nr:diguanylate cyclase [Mariniblastus fucicola]QEG20160.1 Diguanylate cyclase DosC [Mariniblastus fucicola]
MSNILLENLPSPPEVAIKLLDQFAEADVNLNELEKTISAGPTLAARIVQFANSASFARQRAATSLKQAMMVIGIKGVKVLALSFSLTEMGESKQEGRRFCFNEYWRFSLACAVSSKTLYREMSKDEETGFLFGLLMNIGQLALACSQPDQYEEMLGETSMNDPSLIEKEISTFGLSRYELAQAAMESLGFPPSITAAFKEMNAGNRDRPEAKIIEVTHAMSCLFLNEDLDGNAVRDFSEKLAELTQNGLEENRQSYDTALEEYKEIASVLSYKSPSPKSLKEIENEAKHSIIQMTMALHLDKAQVEKENDELKDLAMLDELTGLGNRRQYEQMIQSEISRCNRLNRQLVLWIIDIDNFKSINDTYGHATGDAILIEVASRMGRSTRGYDFLFRIGGEEFVVIQSESTVDTCEVVAERLRSEVANRPFVVDDLEIPITISLGGAIFGYGSATTKEQLFELADKNLYAAKNGGRNQFVIDRDTELNVPTGPTNQFFTALHAENS